MIHEFEQVEQMLLFEAVRKRLEHSFLVLLIRSVKTDRTKGAHVFACTNWLEPNERYLHARQSSNCVPSGVRDIQAIGKAAH